MTLALPDRPDWHELGECNGYPIEWWFPHDNLQRDYIVLSREQQQAIEICHTCPVQTECLRAALAIELTRTVYDTYGIWGGLLPRERVQLRRLIEAA